MKQDDERLKALGAAFRAVLKASEDMPPDVQALLLRMLLRDAIEQADDPIEQTERKRVRA